MALKISHCPMCSGARELRTVAALSGDDGSLKLTVRDLPVLQCAKDHKGPVQRDFMVWLIQEVRERGAQIASGREEGLIFKKHLCGACGKELGAKPERQGTYPFDLQFEELAPFRAEIDIPVYKCTACGREQARSAKEVHNHVAAAVVGINDRAGFPHSG